MSERTPATPRSELARVVVAGTLAAVLGVGPAVAWDVSTQLPRSHEVRSAWPRPSPWRTAGKQMKAALGGIARAYLPVTTKPVAEDPVVAGSAPSPTTSASVTVGTYGVPTPSPPAVDPIEIE